MSSAGFPVWIASGIQRRTGDCLAPGMIAHAVYSSRRWAREFEEPVHRDLPFETEPMMLEA